MILVIDDLRLFPDTINNIPVVHITNSKDAIEFLEHYHQNIFEIFLDFDLGLQNGVPDDIMPVVHWIEEKVATCPCITRGHHLCNVKVRIITSNPVGYSNIELALIGYLTILPKISHIGIREA